MEFSISLPLIFIFGLLIATCNGCQYCGCYGYPNCDCYCPPWMIIGDDHIVLDHARGQVSVSSSAAASVKYNKGAPQAYISSLSSAKADPKIPVNIVGGSNGSGLAGATIAPQTVAPPTVTRHPTGTAAVTNTSGHTKTTWAYKENDAAYGPENWGKFAPSCNGVHQSPINIDTTKMIKKPLSSKISLTSTSTDSSLAETMTVVGKLVNNGKALGFNIDHKTTPVKLTGTIFGGDVYTLRQFHFHFGCEGEMGSEHAVDGQRAPGEIHLVFTNDKYPSSQVAMQQKDGIAAIAFFIKYDTAAENKAFAAISEKMRDLRISHSSMPMPNGISLHNMIPALKEGLVNLRRFAYKGSLPTPPCLETVTWVVFRRPVGMKPETMENWRNYLMSETDRVCGNFRPIQPLNDRRIYTFVPVAEVTKPATTPPPTKPSSDEDSLEAAGIIPVKQYPLSKLVGVPAKSSDEKLSVADARNELRTASSNANDQAAAGNVDATQTINSAFSKTAPNKGSSLIPEGNGKQESQKVGEKVNTFAGKPAPAKLESYDQRRPTVAPGMRRQF